MNMRPINLPKASEAKQGALHAGIRYQYLKTILAWISLKDRDGYVVSEWIDDCFAVDQGTSIISDTKYINSASSLTLRSSTIQHCLDNAFVHLVQNAPANEICYVVKTNLSAGNENPALSGLGRTGLTAWEVARAGGRLQQDAIIRFLMHDSTVDASLKTYLRTNSAQSVWNAFLAKVWFDLESGDLLQAFRVVETILRERCERYHLPRIGIPSFIEHLESIVSDAARLSTPKAEEPRILRRSDFETAWDHHFMQKSVSYTQWCKETYGTGRLTILEEADDWLDQKYSGGYSRREMLEKGIAYFADEETAVQQTVISRLVGRKLGGNATISGNVGSGKSFVAASVAMQLSAQAYRIYYASINPETQPAELFADIQLAQERSTVPIVVILDDCHRNFEVILKLGLRRSKLKVPALLFVANSQDLFLREQAEIEFADVLDLFKDDEALISTNLSKPHFVKKVEGIIDAWLKVHPSRKLQMPDELDITVIASEAHGNLSSLKAALMKWEEKSALKALVRDEARGLNYRRFLSEERSNEAERSLLLQTAAVSCYEVDFSVPDTLRNTAKTLRERGLLEKTTRDQFRFLDIARPRQLIDAFLDGQKDADGVFAGLLCNYIESHHYLPANAGQLLLAIATERDNTVIQTLFGRRETLLRIEAFLATASSNRVAIEFLFRCRDVVDRSTLRRLFADLVVDLPTRFTELATNEGALLIWTKCLRLSSYCDRAIVDRLHKNVDVELVEAFVGSSGFHQLAYCVWTLSDIDLVEAKSLLAKAHFDTLLESAAELPPLDFVRAIRRLREVDVKWTQQFCSIAAGDRTGPFFCLLNLAVDVFATALGELNWYDELSVKKFLSDVENDDLRQFTDRSSTSSLAIALSTLKDVDRLFAKRFLDVTTDSDPRSRFSRQSISKLGNSLSELYRVSDARARSELQRYSDDDLLTWARSAPLFKLGKTFAELGKIDAQRIARLFARVGYRSLAEKAQKCESVGHLTKALSELASIDRERACFILDSIGDKALIEMFQVCSVDSLGRSLREIQNVDEKQAEWVAGQLRPHDIVESYRDVSLRNLGHYLSEVRTVSPRLAKAILDLVDPGLLAQMVAREASLGEIFGAVGKIHGVEGGSKRMLGAKTKSLLDEAVKRFPIIANQKRCRFEEISNGLRAINGIDSVTAKKLFQSLSFSKLEAKLRAEQAEKVLVALGSLSKIDRDTCVNLLDRILDESFITKATLLAPDRLASAINSVALVSKEHANRIVESIKAEPFRKSFIAMDTGRQTQVGRKLAAFSQSQAERLLGSYAWAPAKPRKNRRRRQIGK